MASAADTRRISEKCPGLVCDRCHLGQLDTALTLTPLFPGVRPRLDLERRESPVAVSGVSQSPGDSARARGQI